LLYVRIIKGGLQLTLNEEEEQYLPENIEVKNIQLEIHNKHDKCFRDILSDKTEIINFLTDFINPNNTIKPEEIEAYNTSFVTSKYQNKEADIIYKIKGKNAFILIEHQSKKDKNMQFRLLEYYTEILRTTEIKQDKMPVVIPIIIYTGTENWKINGYISEKQEILEGYQEGRLDIKYNLVQANNFKTEELLSKKTMIANAMIIENSNDTEELMENLKKIIKNIKDKEKLVKLKNIVKYILKGILEKENIEKIVKRIDEKEEIYNMDELIERIKKNDKKKMKKIVREVKEEMIKGMLNLGIDKEKIQEIAQIKLEEIEKIQANN